MIVRLGNDYLNLANVLAVTFAGEPGQVRATVETCLCGTLVYTGEQAEHLRAALELLALRTALPGNADEAPDDYRWLESSAPLDR